MNSTHIIIAGGKTGGHLFPGIAVAQALESMNPNVKILFVGTSAPFEIQTLEKYGFTHNTILSKPVKGGSLFKKALSLSIILVSLVQSMIIMKRFKPDAVLGVGGFSSFAVVLSAWISRIPTAIQEQNAFPGMTNRMLSRFAGTIFTSFKETRGLTNNHRVSFVGNPVRKATSAETGTDHDLIGFDPDLPTLLVTGGSQGASSINRAFMNALELMTHPGRFNIIHQTGLKEEGLIQETYTRLKITATARAFFHNMPALQTLADVAITRAGAGIISELCIKGLPAILVPFPHAADDHQTFNAAALEEQGAAILIKDCDLTGEKLKQTIERLIEDKERLAGMAENLKRLALPDADKKIAAHLLKMKPLKR